MEALGHRAGCLSADGSVKFGFLTPAAVWAFAPSGLSEASRRGSPGRIQVGQMLISPERVKSMAPRGDWTDLWTSGKLACWHADESAAFSSGLPADIPCCIQQATESANVTSHPPVPPHPLGVFDIALHQHILFSERCFPRSLVVGFFPEKRHAISGRIWETLGGRLI